MAEFLPDGAPTSLAWVSPRLSPRGSGHALVIPVYRLDQSSGAEFAGRLRAFLQVVNYLIVIDNEPKSGCALSNLLEDRCTNGVSSRTGILHILHHGNVGGLAGAFNRGIEFAIALGASTITLLDQDSLISPDHLRRLASDLPRAPWPTCLIGPSVWDLDRRTPHTPWPPKQPLSPARLLLSSGTTFAAAHWPLLGNFPEHLFIDYLDHYWCFRARSIGFNLYIDSSALLFQSFGLPHPSRFCRGLGMQMYSPLRHYTSLRNLLWLVRQPEVPVDIRLKELAKMLVKPWLWVLFEPRRVQNLAAIMAALLGRSFHGI
jgi:rhamnosyltransferase